MMTFDLSLRSSGLGQPGISSHCELTSLICQFFKLTLNSVNSVNSVAGNSWIADSFNINTYVHFHIVRVTSVKTFRSDG